jgi:hypothetical protein
VTAAEPVAKKRGIARADAAREHHRQAHCPREAPPRARRAQTAHPFGKTASRAPSSTSSSIGKRRTRSSASRTRLRRSSKRSSDTFPKDPKPGCCVSLALPFSRLLASGCGAVLRPQNDFLRAHVGPDARRPTGEANFVCE